MLVDMHIADWNPDLLAKYDPARLARMYEQAGLDAVMFYCQSHMGLCYWPTASGKMHANLRGRDIVGEMLGELDRRGLDAIAYYSVIYNNWAFLERPEWRQHAPWANVEDRHEIGSFSGCRYGLVCPNNPDYRDFVRRQIEELIGGYRFAGLFYDMTFWPTLCLCPHCRERYRQETGAEFPEAVDWFAPAWCRWQAAREAWMADFAALLTAQAKEVHRRHHPDAPELTVHHNCASIMSCWSHGVNLDTLRASDFLGGDFYGDPISGLLTCKNLANLTNRRPIEFMTSRCLNLGDHERTKPVGEMEQEFFAATLFSAAFLAIDAVNLDGTVNSPVYRRIGQLFRKTKAYEPFLGGEPVEDVAVYFSPESRVDFAENGRPLAKADMGGRNNPHMRSLRGACRLLQQRHIPFGVISRARLGELSRYRAVLLPNVLRLDAAEIAAFRAYVQAGGSLYASGYTSLVSTKGVRHSDFQLADVFGCHLAADDLGPVNYLKPAGAGTAKLIEPQRFLSHFGLPGKPGEGAHTLRLAEGSAGEALATLTLPYGKEWGGLGNQNWASIHSSPPWRDTAAPAVLFNRFGAGKVIYSAADLEIMPGEANDAFFHHLLGLLLDAPPSHAVEAHPCVWTQVANQPENSRLTVGFLNRQEDLPAIPLTGIRLTLRPPAGRRFTGLVQAPDLKPVPYTCDPDGTLHAKIPRLKTFHLFLATYS